MSTLSDNEDRLLYMGRRILSEVTGVLVQCSTPSSPTSSIPLSQRLLFFYLDSLLELQSVLCVLYVFTPGSRFVL